MVDTSAQVRRVIEYAQVEVDISEDQARLLQTAAGDRLTVTPNNVGYQIKATSYVGTISVPGFVLHIDPKVPVWNLLYLLTWSTHRLQVNPQDVARAGGDLTTALTVLYTQMLERVLVLGVDRAYVEETDRLVSLRGRIDWPTQSRSAGLPHSSGLPVRRLVSRHPTQPLGEGRLTGAAAGNLPSRSLLRTH